MRTSDLVILARTLIARGAGVLGLVLLIPAAASAQRTTAELAPPEMREVQVVEATDIDYPPARAYRLESLEETSESFYSATGVGSIILQNSLARFGFTDAPSEGSLLTERGTPDLRRGTLQDIVTTPKAIESFNLFTPAVASIQAFRLVVDEIEHRAEPNDQASVIVTGHDYVQPHLEARTEYRMMKDLPGALVTTTLTNTHESEQAVNVTPSDVIFWGGMSPFVPGVGAVRQSFNAQQREFVFAQFDDLVILIAPESGTFDVVTTGGEAMALLYGERIDMEPGETRVFRRYILVGQEDPAFLFSHVLKRRANVRVGTLVGRLIERERTADGQTIERAPIPNTEVFISPVIRPDWAGDFLREMAGRPYLIARTRAGGDFDVILPEGEYQVYPASRTRLAPRPAYAARISPDRMEGFDFGASRPSRLVYQIVDADTGERIPGKLTFEPFRGVGPLELGALGRVQSMNTVLSSHGVGAVDLPPGEYRVTVSRGPEYNVTRESVTIASLKDTEMVFPLKRAFQTPGWVSADIGARTDATPLARTSAEGRVVSAVAEGVEWLVTGDSGVVTDLEDVVESLGLSRRLRTSPGFRRSGSTPPFIGDFMIFPLDICGTGANPEMRHLATADDARTLIETMRALCPEGVVMLSRPTWPLTGYLTMQGYNHELPSLPAGDYSIDIDAIQVWEGKRQGLLNRDYLTMHKILRQGQRVAPIGNTNTHGTLMQETGYPRVYIMSSTDNPAEINPEELARNIKMGLVSVSNGPFVRLRVGGESEGVLVTDTSGAVTLEVEVYAANWVRINSIRINVNGIMTRQILLNPDLLNPDGGLVFPPADRPEDGLIEVRLTEDSIIDVLVEGSLDNPMDPVNPFNAFSRDTKLPRGQFPVALSAPIYIDVDGNGRLDLRPLPPVEVLPGDEPDLPF